MLRERMLVASLLRSPCQGYVGPSLAEPAGCQAQREGVVALKSLDTGKTECYC